MRRLVSSALVLTFLSMPANALGALGSPSALLNALQTGNPRDFTAELHGHVEDEAYISLWMRGSVEGRTPKTAKAGIYATLDVHADGTTKRMRTEMLIYQENLYFRLDALEGFTEYEKEGLPYFRLIDKWIKIPLKTDMMAKTPDDQYEQIAMLLRQEGYNVTADDVRELRDAVIDAVFEMKREKFNEGYAYTLTLHPDALRRVLSALQSQLRGIDPRLVQELDIDLNDPEITEAQTLLNKAVSMEIKFDLNATDELLFGKEAVTISVPEMNIGFELHSTLNHRSHPVYLDVPTETTSLEEAQGLFSSYVDLNLGGNLFMRQQLMQGLFEEELVPHRPYMMEPTEPAVYEPEPVTLPGRSEMCDQLDVNSPRYIQLSRKGICPRVTTSNVSPRRMDDSDLYQRFR